MRGVPRLVAIAGLALVLVGGVWFGWDNIGTNIIAGPRQAAAVQKVETQLSTAQPAPPEPKPMQVYGVITIERIDLRAPIVEGTGDGSLELGVGHYAGTPQPGQPGNVGLAGHRTTYGKPFWDLQLLRAGDLIELRTSAGVSSYSVVSHEIVTPDRVDVVAPPTDPGRYELTLTTCHPRFSAAERYVVHAELRR